MPPPTGTPTPESSSLPTMNVYLPEGEFDIRLKRLIIGNPPKCVGPTLPYCAAARHAK